MDKGGEDEVMQGSDLNSQPSQNDIRPSQEKARKKSKFKSLASNKYEKRLLGCIVNTDNIPAKYENMYVADSIIRQLERVTKRSLERVKAFNHGVLKGSRITGALLWGPPGTGKSLLAKGLAKESGFNMLSISSADLWQKFHGEDEKVIKAAFSMGRKLHPCIIFIDEADAMLGTREAGEKRHLRSMLNQFLLEWDGLMSDVNTPFVLLATNRPFDLDPAVLRRAPVHIKIDVPRSEDRRQILRLLLKDESFQQDKDRVITSLASNTHNYTGSDLKSLCVTAATLCVDEQSEDTDVRALAARHFEEAMKTVRPIPVSDKMKNEFRQFDNEY